MKHFLRAVLPLLLALLLALPISALEPVHKASAEYLASPYYKNLQELQLTGDQRTDIVLVALSQMGYHEGNGDADLGGLNTDGWRDFAEYNRLYGKVDNQQGNGVSYGYYWCCAFATWCVRQAGVTKEVAPNEISCRRLVNLLSDMGVYHAKDGYTPRKGDWIFFRDSGSKVSTHIGIVMYVHDGVVYTIEGNTNTGNVATRNYELTSSYIQGYGSPAYTENEQTAIDFNPHTGGYRLYDAYYYITASSLNVRTGAGVEHAAFATLANGEKVVLLEINGNWARIDYDGREGWISLSYVQYVPMQVAKEDMPLMYTVRIGDTEHRLLEGQMVTLPEIEEKTSDLPAAYTWGIRGWDTDGDGAADAQPGATLTPKSDMDVKAIYEQVFVPYSIRFVRPDGSLIEEQTYRYGEMPVPPAGELTVPEDGSRFVGWDAEITVVSHDKVYTARYEAVTLPDDDTPTGDDTPAGTDPGDEPTGDDPAGEDEQTPDEQEKPDAKMGMMTVVVTVAAAIVVAVLVGVVIWLRRKNEMLW